MRVIAKVLVPDCHVFIHKVCFCGRWAKAINMFLHGKSEFRNLNFVLLFSFCSLQIVDTLVHGVALFCFEKYRCVCLHRQRHWHRPLKIRAPLMLLRLTCRQSCSTCTLSFSCHASVPICLSRTLWPTQLNLANAIHMGVIMLTHSPKRGCIRGLEVVVGEPNSNPHKSIQHAPQKLTI